MREHSSFAMYARIYLSLSETGSLALTPVTITGFQLTGSHEDFPSCGIRYSVHSYLETSQAIFPSSESEALGRPILRKEVESGKARMEAQVSAS